MEYLLLKNQGGSSIKMPQKKFIRTNARNYSKLGVRRKNKQKYRKGKGIDNKMRLNMKGHSRKVKAGFRTEKKSRDLIKDLKPIVIYNIKDLKKIAKENIGIIGKVGAKKRKEIAEYAIEKNIKLSLDPKAILRKIENKFKQTKEKQEKRKAKKIEKDKKAQKEAEKKAKKEAKEEAKANKPTQSDNAQKDSSEDQKKEGKSDAKKVEAKKPEQKDNKKEIQTNNYGRGK